MNYEIVFASSNKNKVQEVREILCPHGILVYGLNDLGISLDGVEENGTSYKENALIKAKAIQKYTTFPIIADDSGIEILSMDNKPGLFSARFAKECGGHDKAIHTILNEIKGKDRSARFVCDIILLNVDAKPLLFEGIVEGTIAEEPYGKGGFGYDPIFIPNDSDKTYAEIEEKEKNKASHRGKALKKLLTFLRVSGLIS